MKNTFYTHVFYGLIQSISLAARGWRLKRETMGFLILWGVWMFAGGAAQGSELLVKYDFEADQAWLPDWGGGFGGKYQPATAWQDPFKVILDKTEPHSGEVCLKMETLSPVAGEKILHTGAIPLPVSAENRVRKVTIRFFSRARGFREESLQLRGFEKDGTSRTLHMLHNEKALVSLPAAPEWREVRWRGEIDPNTRQLMLVFAVVSDEAPAALWLDDISVELESNEVTARQP